MKIIKNLIIAFILLILIKTVLSAFILVPTEWSDYYIYSKLARSFLYNFSFNVDNMPTILYPPLYPIFISISYFFKDMNLVYFFMKFINSILSSLIIFPAFLLAKEFLDERKAFLTSLLIGVLPYNFSFAPYIMAENLFFPLSLFTIYFLYKSLTSGRYYWPILLGIFAALTYLTKSLGLIMIPLIGFVYLVALLRKKEFLVLFKKIIIFLIFFAITISPWLIRNFNIFGFSSFNLSSIFALFGIPPNDVAPLHTSISSSLLRILLYLGFIILSSGIIFFMLNFTNIKKKIKNYNYFIFYTIIISSLVLSVISGANHDRVHEYYQFLFNMHTGKFVGRYLGWAISLIIIGGIVSFSLNNYKIKRLPLILTLITSILLILSSQIIYVSLFPINNLSLTWLGIMNYLFNYFVYHLKAIKPVFTLGSFLFFTFLFFILSFIFYYLKKISFNKVLLYSFIFFTIINLINFPIIYYDSYHNWYNIEQIQLGMWFNKNYQGNYNILFDERDSDELTKQKQVGIYTGDPKSSPYVTLIGFWMNDNISIGNVNNLAGTDFVISKHELNLEKVKETNDGVFLYKVK